MAARKNPPEDNAEQTARREAEEKKQRESVLNWVRAALPRTGAITVNGRKGRIVKRFKLYAYAQFDGDKHLTGIGPMDFGVPDRLDPFLWRVYRFPQGGFKSSAMD